MQEELANEAVSYTIGRLTLAHYLTDLPHHVSPCHNLHKNLTLDEEEAVADATHFFKPFPYVCSFPVPISPTFTLPRKVLNGLDPATILIRKNNKWEKEKRRILKANNKDKKHIDTKLLSAALSNNNGTSVVPRGVAVLASHLQSDPDSRFSGNYNWYYSGGNLATSSYLEETYLVYTNTVMGVLSLAKLSTKENVLEMDSTSEPFALNNSESGNNEPILEVVTEKELIAVRQKNRVHVIKTRGYDGNMKLNTIQSIESKETLNEGFVSVALASQYEGDYCVLSNCGILRMYQLDTSEKCTSCVKVQPGDGVLVSDNWGSVHYSDPNILLLADRCCIHLLDHRCGLEEKQLAWCPRSMCEHCEEISLCIPSSIKSHVQYIGTNHQVLSLDLRSGFSQRWTHLLHSSPYIGFAAPINGSCEMLIVGAQPQHSVSSIINTWENDEAKSCSLPFTLSSPVEGLQYVRSQGECLEPGLLTRCDLSLTGLTYFPKQNGLFLLRSSSVGDIFCQQLQEKRRADVLPELEVEYFSKMEATGKPEPVRVTATDDFSDVFEAINNWNSDPMSWSQSKLSLYDKNEEDWKVSKSYLENCVDMLAAPILSVWELDDEPEWKCSDENSVEEQDPADKVLNWLGNGAAIPQHRATSPLAEPLSQAEIKIEETELFDITDLNSYPSQFAIPRIPSPTLSQHSAPSVISMKRLNLSETTAEQTLGASQSQQRSQTPRKKFISGF